MDMMTVQKCENCSFSCYTSGLGQQLFISYGPQQISDGCPMNMKSKSSAPKQSKSVLNYQNHPSEMAYNREQAHKNNNFLLWPEVEPTSFF